MSVRLMTSKADKWVVQVIPRQTWRDGAKPEFPAAILAGSKNLCARELLEDLRAWTVVCGTAWPRGGVFGGGRDGDC